MADLLGLDVIQGGAVTLVAVIVLLILRGHLVPRSVLRDVRADRDKRIAEITAERDTWREACRLHEAAQHTAQGQVGELLELAHTADHLLRSLPKAEVTSAPLGPQLPP